MCQLSMEPEGGFPTNTGMNPVDLDEMVALTDKCMVPAFQTVIAHGWTKCTMMTDQHLNMMTQAPYLDDATGLLNRIYITRAYMDMKPGSCQVAVIIQNMTSKPIHLMKGKTVAQVMASNAVPNVQPSLELLKKLNVDEPGEDKPHLSIQERQELLLSTLQKDGGLERLKSWPPDLAAKAIRLLLEFHSIFSLEPHEISCTDVTEHDIELLDHEPFKERF